MWHNMYCSKCGNYVEESEQYCKKCGNKIGLESESRYDYGQTKPYEESNKKDSSNIWCCILGFIFPIAGIVLFFLMRAKKHKWPVSILVWSLAGWAVGIMVLGVFESYEEKYYGKSFSTQTPYTYTEDYNYEKDLVEDYPKDNQVVKSTYYETVDIKDLLDELDANALRAEQTYNGKYIEVSGKLNNIDSSGDYISICKFNDDWGFDSIHCSITDPSQLDFIARINVGDAVTIRGEITSVGEILGYSMDIHEISR